MKRFFGKSWLVLAVLAACSAGSARAGALDDKVPQDALIYLGWAGAEALGPQYANSNLKGVLDASQIGDFVNKQLPKLIEQAGARDPGAPEAIAKLQQGLGVAWRHPTAFYFCPPDFANPRMPTFRFGLLCDAGADAKGVTSLLNEVLAQAPANPQMPIRAVQDGTMVMLTFGKADTLEDLKKGGGLAGAADYKATMAKVKQDAPALAVYVDVSKGIATINDAMSKVPGVPAEVRAQIAAMIDATGYGNVTQMAYLGGFSGKGWSQHAYFGFNGAPKGLLGLMDGGPISEAALAMVPKDAGAFSAWKLDVGKMLTETRSLIAMMDPQGQGNFDGGMAAANEALGLNIEKDILAPLGNEWVSYSAPISDEGGNSLALATHLKDGATFAKSLAKLEGMFNKIPNVPIHIEKIQAAKTEVSTLAFLNYSIAWGVKNDTLYVSSLGGIGGAIRQVESKAASIMENGDYKAARAALPANVKPLAISYVNPAKVYPEFRRTALGLFPLIRRAGVDLPMELLPETADVAPFMPPGASITWSQADGIYSAGNAAFPGADWLGGQQLIPGVISGAASVGLTVVPRVAGARGGAARSVDMANLRGISQSALVFAADHKDAMPDDLARLVVEGMIAPSSLVSRRSGTVPLEMTAEMEKLAKEDFAKFAAQVKGHCDFVYLGSGTKSEVNAGVIVAYEKPGPNTPDGITVAFQDAHVEFITWLRLPAAFEATNAFLKKAGKPEVDVDALIRGGGPAAGNGLP